MEIPKYQFKLVQELVWAALFAAGFVLFTVLANMTAPDDWTTWFGALGMGILRAVGAACLNVVRQWIGTRNTAAIGALAFIAGVTMLFAHGTAQADSQYKWAMIGGTNQTPQQYLASEPCVISVWHFVSAGQYWTHYYRNVPDYVNGYNSFAFMPSSLGYFVAYDAACVPVPGGGQ